MDDSKIELLAGECVKVCKALGIVDGNQPLTGPELLLIMSDAVKAIRLLQVQSLNIHFTYEVPEEFRGRGRGGCAFDSGFECGYRNWKYDNPYTSEPHYKAWTEGYFAGKQQAQRLAEEKGKHA